MCTRTCKLLLSKIDNFVHATVMFRYTGKLVNPEMSPETNVSGLTRHHCIGLRDHNKKDVKLVAIQTGDY